MIRSSEVLSFKGQAMAKHWRLLYTRHLRWYSTTAPTDPRVISSHIPPPMKRCQAGYKSKRVIRAIFRELKRLQYFAVPLELRRAKGCIHDDEGRVTSSPNPTNPACSSLHDQNLQMMDR